MSKKPQGLAANPKRQAHHVVGGLHYQLLHSLHAWLFLHGDQVLFLEGAEDLDLISSDSAVTVQIKKSRRPISLRAPVALKTLDNFLEISNRNAGHEVYLRFLTTAEIAVERGEPFGPDVAGIEVWNKPQDYADAATKLKAFLLSQPQLPADLHKFLEGASEGDFMARLVRPVKWETGSSSPGAVEKAIEEKLIVHGEHYGVPPEECVRLVGSLLKHVMDTARSPADRSLRHPQFLELFQELTTVRVPRRSLGALGPNPFALARLDDPHTKAISYREDVSPVKPQSPPSIPILVRREQLVERLSEHLARSRILFLTGSTGVGKTSLAKTLTGDATSVRWAECTAKSAPELGAIFRQLIAALGEIKGNLLIVLDDLSLTPQILRTIQAQLIALIFSLERAPGREASLVITSQSQPPSVLRRTLESSRYVEERVTNFDSEEIAEFARLLGCPADIAEQSKAIINFQTSGHPQLVHALLIGQRDRGWPAITKKDNVFSEPREVARERREARSILLSTLAPDAARLLYYLSLISGRFRRDHAKAVSELEAVSIPNGGDTFDSVVGPWVEQVTADYYQVSPLLANAAADNWSPSRLKIAHADLARIILEAGNLTLREVGNIVMHSLIGGADRPLMRICLSLITTSPPSRSVMAEYLDWIAVVELSNTTEFNPLTRCIFRVVQFRVAVQARPDLLENIITSWQSDINLIEDHKTADFQRCFLAGEIVSRIEAPLPPQTVVDALVELVALANQHQEIQGLLRKLGSNLETGLVKSGDPLSDFFPLVAFRCRGADDVRMLLKYLTQLAPEIRERLLWTFRDNGIDRALFVDHAWTQEVKREDPEWSNAIDALEYSLTFAKREEATAIELTAYLALAAVYSEHLNDSETAQRYLDEAEESLGVVPLIKYQRGAVFMTEGRYSAALEIFDEVLEIWRSEKASRLPDTRYTDILFAYRNAGMSAAHLNRWDKAATSYRDAAEFCGSVDFLSEHRTGLLADAGFCIWRVGRFQESVTRFEQALTTLDELPPIETHTRSRVLSKLVGHVLLWIVSALRRTETSDLGEPKAGLCSDTTVSKEIAELVPTPLDMNWLHLAQMEYLLLGTTDVFQRHGDRLTGSRYAVVRMLAKHLRLRDFFLHSDLRDLPEIVADLGRENRITKLNRKSGHPIWQPDTEISDVSSTDFDEVGTNVLVAAMLKYIATGLGDTRELIASWNSAVVRYPGLSSFLDDVADVMALGSSHTLRVLRDGHEEGGRRLLAALRLVDTEKLSPEARFYAHFAFVDVFAGGPWADVMEKDLASLVDGQWRRHLASPATLRSPRLSIPEITSALEADSQGMTRVGQILLAARLAVNVNLTGNTLSRLKVASEAQRIFI